jgi:hypothetical protein
MATRWAESQVPWAEGAGKVGSSRRLLVGADRLLQQAAVKAVLPARVRMDKGSQVALHWEFLLLHPCSRWDRASACWAYIGVATLYPGAAGVAAGVPA